MKKNLISIVILFFWSAIVFSVFAQPNYHFQKFALNDKLPSNSVVRMYNDSEGYMWFGTMDGLCRYDGYEIKVFRSSALTPGKLPNNEIQCMAGDGNHKLWVGTLEGIVIVDKKNFTVTKFSHPLTDRERINSICIDNKGDVWIATSNSGVLRHNPTSGTTTQYFAESSSNMRLPAGSVNHIYQDSKGRIWISMWRGGLFYIEADGNKIFQAPQIGKTNNPFRFFEDKDGDYWICTWGDGVFKLDFSNNRLTVNPLMLSEKSIIGINNIVYSIAQDDNDYRIWMVTFKGLAVLNKEPDGTVTAHDAREMFDESTSGLFHEVIKDRRGNLWVGTIGEGLFRLDFNKLPIQNYTFEKLKETLNAPAYITQICETPSFDMFIAVNRVGVFWFDPKTSEVARPSNAILRGLNSVTTIDYIKHSKQIWLTQEGEDMVYVTRNKGRDLELVDYFSLKNTRIASENSINIVLEDSKNNIWFGTDWGLYVKPFKGDVKKIGEMSISVTSLYEDKSGHLWVGTSKEGAFRSTTSIKSADTKFENIPLAINNYNSYNVQSINSSTGAEIYIGTREGCLFLFDQKENKAKEISGEYGITEEGIMDILVDDSGVLWMSTIKRIVRYNPETRASTYFSNSDGVLVNLFHKDAVLKSKSGKLLFGGNNGILLFDPSQQKTMDNRNGQEVHFTDVLVQNKSIFDAEPMLYYNALKNRVTLKYSENNLSIEFSALNYVTAGKIQYAYKMSGIDKNWNYVGNTRRFVNYANLPPGSYTFMVKSNDENGLWNEQISSLNVVIKPPLYLTWWAYLLYLLVSIIGAVVIFRNLSNRIRLRNELKISKIEMEKTEELAQVKLRYFTNISHELLTPLTIIMLQIDSMQQKIKGEMVQFDVMRDNVLRLKRLIQQILVFRKTESGNMKLKIQKTMW